MIVDNCVYSEISDNSPVEQYGFVDLCEVISNGAVPTFVSDTDVDYNGIEDPASILGKPHDVFEAYRMQDYVKNAGMKSDNKSVSAGKYLDNKSVSAVKNLDNKSVSAGKNSDDTAIVKQS